ncbi:MAG: ATP-binding protein [Bacteroidales bacterium]|nr:ATP-binding protein [Bacteroidales bacterium]
MIERFTVENYKSYQREETLSFLASNREKSSVLPPQWYKEIDGKRLLRLLICVGLNGTGKSKMFSALNYLRMIVIAKPKNPTDRPEYRPFLLDNDSRTKPTVLSLTYYIGTTGYYYKVSVSNDRIEEELLRQMEGNVLIYQRSYNTEKDTVAVKFGPACDLSKNDQRMLESSVNQNATVLSVFGDKNLNSRVLRDNFNYYANNISLVQRSDQSLADRLKTNDPERDKQVKKMLLKLLNDVGTNIVDYEVDDTSIHITDLVKSGAPDIVVKAMMEQYPTGTISHKNLRFIHKTAVAGEKSLDVGAESVGTISIVRLLVVMYDIVMGRKCSCIDEIETGIHTKALAFIIKMYLSIAEDCQIVVATHDLSLLNHPILRRDAVRMFEKDDNGCTYIRKHEYVHNTLNFQKIYCKKVDPKLDNLLEDTDLFLEYRKLMELFLSEFAKPIGVKK